VMGGTVAIHDTARGEGGFGSTGTGSRPDRP